MTSAKLVSLAIVSYTDQDALPHTQLAVVGDNTVVLVNGKEFGISGGRTDPSGEAAAWLRDAVLKAVKATPESKEE